jgi:hypothetical protein
VTDAIIDQIEFYRSGGLVGRDELKRQALTHFEFILNQLVTGVQTDLVAPRETGRTRPLGGHRHSGRVDRSPYHCCAAAIPSLIGGTR